MSLLDDITAKLPFPKKPVESEHFFAINIGSQKVKAGVWTIEGDKLKVLSFAIDDYSSAEDLVKVTDQLLDQVLGESTIEPEKILFGVPDSWLQDDDLKPAYLKLLRNLVKSLELKPMAYVATSHALTHFLEKQEGAPTTAILVGIEHNALSVTVSRAGKIDGTKVFKRGDNIGEEIERAMQQFTEVGVLPSRMLLFGTGGAEGLEKQKSDLLSFPWMAKLSFLHFPKIDVLEDNVDIKAISLAGAVELNPHVKYDASAKVATPEERHVHPADNLEEVEDLGFIEGDISQKEITKKTTATDEESVLMRPGPSGYSEDNSLIDEQLGSNKKFPFTLLYKLPKFWDITGKRKLFIPIVALVLLLGLFGIFSKASITVFVEPRILERDAQVTADPNIKVVDEANKKIPGQVIETQISGSMKDSATGKKQVGDPAKGTVTIYNKTNGPKTFDKGTTLIGNNLKFTLDLGVTIASQSASASEITFGKSSGNVTAVVIGADGNLPSGTALSIASLENSQFSAMSEGNFSGGNSKDVTVVTDADQKKLLASLGSDLRKQAQGQLQTKLNGKKILEEALLDEIVQKSFSKNINDQAQDFSLNMTVKYKGTAYIESDLKSIVAKLVETNVPEGYQLNLAETETQADVSKLEKDGRLIFLARFKAKLIPKIDTDQIKKKVRGLSIDQAVEIIKGYENVLGAEIKIIPNLPARIARLPLIDKNISIEVKLK